MQRLTNPTHWSLCSQVAAGRLVKKPAVRRLANIPNSKHPKSFECQITAAHAMSFEQQMVPRCSSTLSQQTRHLEQMQPMSIAPPVRSALSTVV